MSRSQRIPALAALSTTAICWSLAPVFIRVLSTSYDPFTQAFVRYASASLALIVFSLVGFRREFLRLLRNPGVILAMAVLGVTQQCFWTAGCYGSTATVAQLITKLTVVFVVIFSFFLFHEERAVIRSPIFLVGTLLSLVGVAGVLTRNPASLVPAFDKPTLYLLLTALCWAVYIVWAKHVIRGVHPVPMFTVFAIFTSIGLAGLSLLLGKSASIISVGPRITAIAFLSGLLPIAIAHPCFHYAQKRLGAAFSTSFQLLNPLLTYGCSLLIWPDERLLASQWAGSGVLLAGTFLVILAGHRAHAASQPFARY